MATVGGIDQLPTVSYWSSSPAMANKANYPYFGRTFPSDTTRAPRVIETMNLFNLTNFAIVQTDDAWANAMVKLLRESAEAVGSGVSLVNSYSFDFGVASSVRAAVRRA